MGEENNTLLYQHNNTDDVFNRSVIGGLLYLLNHRLTYKQTWADDTTEIVTVPFVYNLSNNKQNQDFLQDNYTFFGRECFSDKIVDGKFDMLPRFAITYSGSQINSSEITNRFVKGKFMKDENGKLVSYTAFMYSIPLTMNFDVEGWIDNIETAFKLEQSIRDTFYKNQTFRVLYRGMVINCCAGFPEQISIPEKTVSYGFEQDAQLKMTFSLAVETYQPCFDESLAIESDKKMEHIGFDVNLYNANSTPLNKKISLTLFPLDSSIYTAGDTIHIKWEASSNTSQTSTVFLYYITDDGDKHFIGMPIMSMRNYYWKVPASISKYAQPDVVFIDGDIECMVQPKMMVTPDSSGFVSTGSFSIVEKGKFSDSGYVQVSCEYVDDSGVLKIHDCYVAKVDKTNGVEEILYKNDAPEQTFVVTNPKRMKYSKGSYSSKISIGVSYPMDESIFDQIDNILII